MRIGEMPVKTLCINWQNVALSRWSSRKNAKKEFGNGKLTIANPEETHRA
jgi:hypothetical protein